jgi:epoxyqueuosine reductase
MGEWVFGCDICQEVCPWNQRFTDPQGEAERQAAGRFAPRPGLPRPLLAAALRLSPQEFNRNFKGSPVKRARRRGYLRNVAVALGNRYAGRPDLAESAAIISALREALLQDPELLVRGHAAWALGRIGGQAARQALQAAFQSESEASVLAEIQAALRNFEGPDLTQLE